MCILFFLPTAHVLMANLVGFLQLCDAMETQMEEGGNVIDFHSCDFFPEDW